MMGLLLFKDKLKNFYNSYEVFIRPIMKFLVVFMGLMLIKYNIGYMDSLCLVPVLVGMAVVAAFLPWGLIVVMISGIIVAHVAALTIELALVIAMTLVIMFLVFFRFTPKDGLLLILVPMAFYLKIPYVIPMVVGLVSTPISIVSVLFGTALYFTLSVISINQTLISNLSSDETTTLGVGTIVNMIVGNKEMILTMFAFTITILLVYAIKRQSIDNAWTKAIGVGSVVNFVILLIGNILMDTKSSIIWLIIGTILSVIIALVLQFFVFSVDYSRIEHTQFEDDEYYYYVKAVPKINVSEPEMNVKRINAQRRQKNKNYKTGNK